MEYYFIVMCSGVNMYAMLTGTLPFTVEPFSLRALHQKMVDKEMSPLPTNVSSGKPANFRTVRHEINIGFHRSYKLWHMFRLV